MDFGFVYLWRDSKNKKWYVGSHKGEPDDGYTHSSTLMESFTMDEKPSYMKRRILAYGFHEDMLELEYKLLRKVRNRDDYYNVNGFPLTPEASAKGGRNNRGKSKSLEHRRKISKANAGQASHWLSGNSELKRSNLSNSMKGNTNSKNHNTKEYSKTQSEAMRKAWERRKNKEKTVHHDFW
tara:strand:- start:316 stop:858 length:543 start_codon:yes stop_codon:yes gene_type:complete